MLPCRHCRQNLQWRGVLLLMLATRPTCFV
jgi:hypothetical protein